MKTAFYHLSFDYELAGIWKPRTPAGFDYVKDAKGYGKGMTEPKTPRICLSSSIEGCFYAIYPNIYSLFEVKNYPHGLFCLYRAFIDTKDKDFVANNILTKEHLVWDAHVTQEVWYKGELEMNRFQQVRITPLKEEKIYTNPFNDPGQERRFVSPQCKIEVVKRFNDFYRRN